jgi:hypothetical protein
MALIFMDGFDKYGGLNSNAGYASLLMTAGEWNSSGNLCTIVAGLSSPGFAMQPGGTGTLTKVLPTNYNRLIGGIRISSAFTGTCGVYFLDGGTVQCCISIASTVTFRNGTVGGTVIATSPTSITANSIHYYEWDITFGNSASYQIWMDGVSVMSGTGDTTASANAFANGFQLTQPSAAGACQFDDLYIFDPTGSTNNAVLLTSPRVETTFPTSDGTVQFGFGAAILGSAGQRTQGSVATVANCMGLRRFTPVVAGTINSISISSNASSATANFRPVIYSDSSGAAGTLMSAGSTVTGISSGVPLTLNLTTPQSLSAGTQYWLGFMTDTAFNMAASDNNALGYRANATFSSGAPGTAPAMTAGFGSWLLWGNLTGVTGNNWYEVSLSPPAGLPSYVFDATVGHEDLYNFGPLSALPAVVYGVAVKAYIQRSDSGAKSVSLRILSSGTDSGGSVTGIVPATSFGWLTSLFITEPSAGAPWTGITLNAAQSGLKVDS